MLEPQSRTLLLDALKPPPDYKLDYAIGTTFTLDLVALLAAPLAFALLDRSGPEGKLSGDPVGCLRHCDETPIGSQSFARLEGFPFQSPTDCCFRFWNKMSFK